MGPAPEGVGGTSAERAMSRVDQGEGVASGDGVNGVYECIGPICVALFISFI